MCLELSEIIKEEEIGSEQETEREGEKERERERETERERDRKAPVFEREWGSEGVVGMRLVHSASQHLWPLSVFPSLSH